MNLSHIINQIGKPPQNKRIAILAIARMDSKRFPGKVILPLAGKPAWWHLIQRAEAACKLAGITPVGAAIATGAESENDILEEQAARFGYDCIRYEPVWNIPGRMLKGMDYYNVDAVINCCCDGPLSWWEHFPLVLGPYFALNFPGQMTWKYGNPRFTVTATTGAIGLTPRWSSELALATAMTTDEYQAGGLTTIRRPEFGRLAIPPRQSWIDFPKEMWDYYRWYSLEVDNHVDGLVLEILYNEFYQPGEVVDARKCIEYIDGHPEHHYNRDRFQSAVNTFVEAEMDKEADVGWLFYCENYLAPENAKKIYCIECGEYLGYVIRSHDIDQLYRPDGSQITGTARISCRQGHFRVWQHTLERTVAAGSAVLIPPE